MSALTHMGQARELARNLEKREQQRNGGTIVEARQRLARRIGVMPGTLYNLVFDRLKRLDEGLRLRLSEYAVRDLEHEIESLSHELGVARSLGQAQDDELVGRLERAAARALALHREAVEGRL